MASYTDILKRLDGLEAVMTQAHNRLQNVEGMQNDITALLTDVANQAKAGGRPSGSYDFTPWANATAMTKFGVAAGDIGATPLMERKRNMQAEKREQKEEAIEQKIENQAAAIDAANNTPTPTPTPMG